MNKNKSIHIYINYSSVLLITAMITCINAKLLNNLVTLNTLNVLKILTARNALIAFYPLPALDIKVISKILNETIHPSKTFILSLIYSGTPIPNILRDISTVKMYVKAILN